MLSSPGKGSPSPSIVGACVLTNALFSSPTRADPSVITADWLALYGPPPAPVPAVALPPMPRHKVKQLNGACPFFLFAFSGTAAKV